MINSLPIVGTVGGLFSCKKQMSTSHNVLICIQINNLIIPDVTCISQMRGTEMSLFFYTNNITYWRKYK